MGHQWACRLVGHLWAHRLGIVDVSAVEVAAEVDIVVAAVVVFAVEVPAVVDVSALEVAAVVHVVAAVVDISADEVAAVVDVSAFIITFVHGGVKILSPQSCPALLSSSCWHPLFSVTPFFLSHTFFSVIGRNKYVESGGAGWAGQTKWLHKVCIHEKNG